MLYLHRKCVCGAEALPQTPLAQITAPPQTPGPYFRKPLRDRKGSGREGRGEGRERREGKRKKRQGRGTSTPNSPKSEILLNPWIRCSTTVVFEGPLRVRKDGKENRGNKGKWREGKGGERPPAASPHSPKSEILLSHWIHCFTLSCI